MRKTRDGFAMFAVIIGVLVLSTVTMTALDMGVQESRSARGTRVSAAALYVADTGVSIERARANWPALEPGQTWTGPWTPLSNGGQYRPTIQRRDDALGVMEVYSITVDGWSPGPRQEPGAHAYYAQAAGGQATVQIWATRFAVSARFTSAIGANGNLRVHGTTTLIDSYDSRNGPYCTAAMAAASPPQCTTVNVGIEGDVHANGTIVLGGGAQVEGDAATVTTTLTDPGNGINEPNTETLQAPQQLYPVETCPEYTDANNPDFIANANYQWPVGGGVYSFRDFRTGGSSIVTFPANQPEVKIYLSGQLWIGGNTLIRNENGTAASLSFIACNRGATPNTRDWRLTGGSQAYFTVYAPNNRVDLSGSSPLFGAIVGNDVNVTGGAAVHYDVSLGVLQGGQQQQFSSIMPRSWRQLLR
jgi:hypothetical protein